MSRHNLSLYGLHFEEIVAKILEKSMFIVHKAEPNDLYDILASKEGKQYIIEVKAPLVKYVPRTIALSSAMRLAGKFQGRSEELILVFCAIAPAEIKEEIKKRDLSVTVVDIRNLLFYVQGDENLKNEMIASLNFSVEDIEPIRDECFLTDNVSETSIEQVLTIGERLKDEIRRCKCGGDDSKKYEEICCKALKYLFESDIALWREQQKSDDNLYRFDLICKIKNEQKDGFWATILQHFNSKYIIFEFKNYKEKITQREIYTTDKYLYLKALRSVAIIISRKGTNENADKAIRGTLRENGKLIISLSDNDFIAMIDKKMDGDDPSEFLYGKFDEIMIDLEK